MGAFSIAALVFFVVVVVFILAKGQAPGGGGGGGGGGGQGTAMVQRDGAEARVECLGDAHLEILSASYGTAPDASEPCPLYNALPAVKAWAAQHPRGGSLAVAPEVFPKAPQCGSPRQLTLRYRCAEGAPPAKATFTPQRENTCSDAQDMLPVDEEPAFHLWTGQDNKNFTADVVPWDPDSRIQLTAAALTPGSRREFLPINPVTRVGVTSRVRTWDNPYTPYGDPAGPCSRAVSLWEVQPFAPGFMEPAPYDSTDGTPYERRTYYQPSVWDWPVSSVYGGPYEALGPGCPAGDETRIGGPVTASKRTYIRPSPAYWLGDWIQVGGEVPLEVAEAAAY